LSKILCDYESAQGVEKGQEYEFESLEAKVIYELYEFLKSLFAQRFPNKSIELEERIHRAKTETEARPVCIECGSNHVVSNGSRWLCQDCGRQFIKNPRRKTQITKTVNHPTF
jgi:ribosomal protein L37AE/L43A